jgi:nitrite reductase/ring-hydroxylating ferredoxin subunit/uncharacterized membrane protein
MTSAKDVMEGKPVRSPLHPALVHLPIGLLPLSVLLDLASYVWPEPELHLVRGATISVAAGIATALLAAAFGFVDYTEIRDDHPAKKPATRHMILNLVAVGIFALSLGLRVGAWEAVRTPVLPLLLSLVGLGLLGYSGYLGGHLVYNDGIGVGRHRRARRLPRQTVLVKGEPGAAVVVGDAQSLKDGETLRVDANGVILAIARAEGSLYAVQEFCTHRYGALSEGDIVGCEVICPWHRSRFDLRTGEVTEGPAKEALRTFPLEVRDGRIWLTLPPPVRTTKG